MKATCSIDIDAAPDKVFYWLDDPDRVMKWLSNVVENENLHETENRVGTTFRQVVKENGRRMEIQGTVTAYEPNKRLAVHLIGKGFEADADYRLEQLGDGTRLSFFSDAQFQGVMKLIGPLMAPFIKKGTLEQLARDFAKLKALCESGPES